MVSKTGVMPTIPEYFKKYINNSIDLLETPKIPCPFHKEDKPSFSFSAERGLWRCFGSCKCGGGVVELHQKNYGIKSKKEAEESLKRLYGINVKQNLRAEVPTVIVDKDKVEKEVAYQRLLRLANTPERWVDMDYVMSRYPVELVDLLNLLESWGVQL